MLLLFFCHIIQSLNLKKKSVLVIIACITLNNTGTSGDASATVLSQGNSLLGTLTLVWGSVSSYPLQGVPQVSLIVECQTHCPGDELI